MGERLKVVADEAGLPSAVVPFAHMWELIEFLSYQRAAVSYQYEASHFTITFTRLDLESAQQILDDWGKVQTRRFATA